MKRIIKRALALVGREQGRICNFEDTQLVYLADGKYENASWQDVDPGTLTSLDYGDLKDTEAVTSTSFFLWQLATGSNYSGSDVEVSNHRVLLEIAAEAAKKLGKTPQECGVFDVYGGWSTYSVAVRLSCTLSAVWQAMEGCLDYPVIDEDDLCVVEEEAHADALESWARSEFRHELINALDDFGEWDLDEIPASDLDQLFYQAADRANEYWIIETGNNAYIDTKKVAAAVTLQELVKLPGIIFLGEPEEKPVFMTALEAEEAGQLVLAL